MKRCVNHIIKNWRSHGATQLSTFAVLIGAFFIIILSLLIDQNLRLLFKQWGQSLQVSLYLEDNLREPQRKGIRSFLEESEYFEDIKYVSKEKAFQDFKSQMSIDITGFDKGFGNPLPASFEMKIIGSLAYKVKGEINNFFQELKSHEGVEDVSYGKDWVQNYISFLTAFSYISSTLIIVLLSGSLFVIGNSIRSSVSHRQKEIEIFELVGATPSFIRRPYIVDGLFIGGLSSSLSLLICYLLFNHQSQYLSEQMGLLSTQLSFFSIHTIIPIILMGMLVGSLGSWLCVSRLNSGWSAARRGKA